MIVAEKLHLSVCADPNNPVVVNHTLYHIELSQVLLYLFPLPRQTLELIPLHLHQKRLPQIPPENRHFLVVDLHDSRKRELLDINFESQIYRLPLVYFRVV